MELIAFDLEEHEESIDELGAYVDELDGDLAEAEAAIYGDEYEDDCCCDDDCDCDDDCCCGCDDACGCVEEEPADAAEETVRAEETPDAE